jgi:hypothetical protein
LMDKAALVENAQEVGTEGRHACDFTAVRPVSRGLIPCESARVIRGVAGELSVVRVS